MESSHYRIVADSPQTLLVEGKYLAVQIGQIVLRAKVLEDAYLKKTRDCSLIEAIYANRWDYRLSTIWNQPLLVDSEGFQHEAKPLGSDPTILRSASLKKGTPLPSVADVIEGHAKSRGWIAFPQLPESIVPHRLIFQTYVYAPGHTDGSVRHRETLELVFDLSVFSRVLDDA